MTETANYLEQLFETVEEGWGLRLAALGCTSCGQAHLASEESAGIPCPACGTGRLEVQPARLRREPPELMLPFLHSRQELKTLLETFVHPVWLAPDDFKTENLAQRTIPLWLPMWLVDSRVRGEWQAQAGFDYQVKSSQEYFEGGRWHTREVIEPRIRWEERRGEIDRHYDNTTAPALQENARLVEMGGGYDLRAAQPYQYEWLRGVLVRIPDLDQEEAWQKAQTALEHKVAADCQIAAGAGHMRNFSLQAGFENKHWTQILLPAYCTWYRDDEGKIHVAYINGQNGRISGQRMASQRKGWRYAGILAGAAGAAFLLSLLCFALGAMLPPLAAVGAMLALLAFGLGVAAIVPAVWPWQWNRNQLEQGSDIRSENTPRRNPPV